MLFISIRLIIINVSFSVDVGYINKLVLNFKNVGLICEHNINQVKFKTKILLKPTKLTIIKTKMFIIKCAMSIYAKATEYSTVFLYQIPSH